MSNCLSACLSKHPESGAYAAKPEMPVLSRNEGVTAVISKLNNATNLPSYPLTLHTYSAVLFAACLILGIPLHIHHVPIRRASRSAKDAAAARFSKHLLCAEHLLPEPATKGLRF